MIHVYFWNCHLHNLNVNVKLKTKWKLFSKNRSDKKYLMKFDKHWYTRSVFSFKLPLIFLKKISVLTHQCCYKPVSFSIICTLVYWLRLSSPNMHYIDHYCLLFLNAYHRISLKGKGTVRLYFWYVLSHTLYVKTFCCITIIFI